jgi:hypothetical protein
MKLPSYLITIGAAAFIYVASPCLSYADDDKGPDKAADPAKKDDDKDKEKKKKHHKKDKDDDKKVDDKKPDDPAK